MYLSTTLAGMALGGVLGLIIGWIIRGWWVRLFGIRTPTIVYEEPRRRGSWWWGPWR